MHIPEVVTLNTSTLLALAVSFSGFVLLVTLILRARQRRARLGILMRGSWPREPLPRSSKRLHPDVAKDYLEIYTRSARIQGFGRRGDGWYAYQLPGARLEDARRRARSIRSGWFHSLIYFIPRELRSPWLDHLLDDRERMAIEGRGRSFIVCATVVQCFGLLTHVLWDRLWDLLTPFKPRSR
jgi:hypothetical protein